MLLLRHGQSHFNKHFSVTRVDPGIPDPTLTDEGRSQIERVAKQLKAEGGSERFDRILASPYWRTLETAEILAAALALPVVIEPLVRERAFFVCDIGSPREKLEKRFGGFSFGDLPDVWWPNLDETEEQLGERCDRFHAQVASWSDWPRQLVATHWGFIRGLTGQSVENATLVAFQPSLSREKPES